MIARAHARITAPALATILMVGLLTLASSCVIADGSSRAHEAGVRTTVSPRADEAEVSMAGVGQAPTELPTCEAPLAQTFATDALAAPIVGAKTYRPASQRVRQAMHRALTALSRAQWHAALRHGKDAGYRICRLDDVVVLAPRDVEHRARIALRIGVAKPVVFEAPHPFHDRGTAEQARMLFERVSARALIVSGTYRCESAGVASGHAGHTSACGSHQPYAVSDMAHVVNTVFHQAHVSLHGLYTDSTMVSLHGMARRGVSISNGTRQPLDGEDRGPVVELTRGLRQGFASVTTCNAHLGVDPDYRLCGTTNVQGRHANGYGGTSIVEPIRATGRFVHLEQSYDVRKNIDAVAAAFERWLAS